MPRRSRALALALLTAGASASAQSAPGDELNALRAAERELESRPAPAATALESATRAGTSLATLDPEVAARLQMPAIEVRMTPLLARELALYQSDSRARSLLVAWIRRAAAYRARIEQTLVNEGLPASLVWVAAAESAFNTRVCSPAGACGMWQFTADTARAMGLRVDAWVDERRDPERSTRAAARYLRELRERFGSWELALAAYNMGPVGLLRSVRKYNTNDFEVLAANEAGLPWETAHYVPRILGLAIATHNEAVFGLGSVRVDPVVSWEDVPVTRSMTLAEIARASRVSESQLREINPALLRARVPPPVEGAPFLLHVPRGSGEAVRQALSEARSAPTRSYNVRLGEGLEEIAARYGMRESQLLNLNGLSSSSSVGTGTSILVPDREPEAVREEAPVIAVDPAAMESAGPSDRTRVFVRLASAEEPGDAARALGVTRAELLAWNGLADDARLQSGMWLQAWVRGAVPTARVWQVNEVELLVRGSDEFHNRAVEATGLVRQRVVVREGDSLSAIAQRFHTRVANLERINRRDRNATLRVGETVVVYTEPQHATSPEVADRSATNAATLPE
ncbi:MAG: transglycosylase SLT domain-containing protein [Polyangiales bacterium]